MITNDGKDLIGKFLISQASEYATHISIGCGAYPLDSTETYPAASEIQSKRVMDFEMTRFPITSKGFVDENGTTKIVFTSEIPTENRYDITEVALWSAGSNNLATNSDSRSIFNFSEPWEAHGITVDPIPYLENIGIGADIDLLAANNSQDYQIFSVSTSNETIRTATRLSRKEGPRFLNKKILMRGDSSSISELNIFSITAINSVAGITTYTCDNNFSAGDVVNISGIPPYSSGGSTYSGNLSNVVVTNATSTSFSINAVPLAWTSGMPVGSYAKAWVSGSWQSAGTHIHLNSARLPISQNSSSDLLKLSFSLIDKSELGTNGVPDYIKLVIEFYKNEVNTSRGFAKKEILILGSDLSSNRYKVIEIPISELFTSEDFTANEISICRVFSEIVDGGSASSNFYMCLDGFRLDNISTENPLYKMVAYSVVKSDGYPITKIQNSNNYVEFRLSLDAI